MSSGSISFLARRQGSLESLSKFSPNIRKLSIQLTEPDITFSKFFSAYIGQWRDLHTVDCGHIVLDMDALAHLSRMPTLTQLDCRLSATLPPSHSPLVFPNLHHLRLFSGFLDPISWLLSRTQLPAIAHLTTLIGGHPSKQAFSSFLSSIQTSGLGTIQELVLLLDYEDVENAEDATPVLGLEDLQPCMTFSNLRYLDININWNMDLTDSGVLALALAWPHLECGVGLEHTKWTATASPDMSIADLDCPFH
ncbi:hypothetical protein OG21DRAFT_1602966 [Imleria badia]|nr:hypothetical protein OG21DRAFT_1602966 [Imleria badia]